MLFAFGAISTLSTFAQGTLEECQPIYEKFLADRKTTADIPGLDKAIASGKEFLEKCGKTADLEAQIKYVTNQVTKFEETRKQKDLEENLYKPFNASVPAKDWDKAFSLGKQVIALNPDFVDVMLVLASIGFDNSTATPPVDKFNGDAINMAKMAIQKMEENKPSTTGDYGAFTYRYKTPTCADGKVNATGWMNFTIGSITYYRLKNLKDSLPYLYKASQVGCETKNFPDIYRMIGAWYLEEAIKINTKRLEAIKAAADQDTDETKAMLALQKGYADRSIDAYARAYKLATSPGIKTTEDYKKALYTKMNELYTFRYDKTDGIDAYIANVNSKPFPDPASAITPVVEEPTTATTPTSLVMPSSETNNTNAVAETRPRTAPEKTVVASTPAAATETTAKTVIAKKAPAKKPVTKKKGTR